MIADAFDDEDPLMLLPAFEMNQSNSIDTQNDNSSDEDLDDFDDPVPDEFAAFSVNPHDDNIDSNDENEISIDDEIVSEDEIENDTFWDFSSLPNAEQRIDVPFEDTKNGWKTKVFENTLDQYSGLSKGSHDQSLDGIQSFSKFFYWNLIFTDELINTVVEETNDYADRWRNATDEDIFDRNNPAPNKFRPVPQWLNEEWEETNYEEILLFFAIHYIMAYVKLPRLRCYWETKYHLFNIPNIRGLMSYKRFTRLKCCLHLVSWNDLSNDPAWKVDRFMKKFRSNCRKNWRCGKFCAFDEMMSRFSGNSKITFRKQPKPTPDGLKLLALADGSIPYLYDFDLDRRDGPKLPHIMEIVEKLEDKGRVIVIDRGYVTLDLIQAVHDAGFFVIGTIKKYQYLPMEFFNSKKLTSGEWMWSMKQNPPVIVTSWCDSSPQVLSVSTFNGPVEGTVERKAVGVHGKLRRNCPYHIQLYNKYYGRVDTVDALRAHLTTLRKCKKWWHSLFYFFLDISAINGQRLYESVTREKVYRFDFMHSLIIELLERSANNQVNYENLRSTPLLKFQHWPHVSSGKISRICSYCFIRHGIKSKTQYVCECCKNRKGNHVHLHPECFQEFHNNFCQ